MKDLLRYFTRLLKRKEVSKSPLSDVSGCLNFFWDSKTGDFTVSLDVNETTDASAEVLGMLMCYIDGGQLNQFLVESLKYWCDTPDKMEFYTKVLQTWNVMIELQKADQLDLEDSPMVHPSDVFRLSKGNANGNPN